MSKTWVVTGANKGIGLELARQLKARGERVYATCRSSSKELDALGVNVVSGVEVSSDDAGDRIARALGDGAVDVLLHNAGIMPIDALDTFDVESARKTFEVNAVAPLRITRALLPKLGRGAKIALMTSRMGSIADNGSGRMYAYRMSKAALNIAGMSMTRDLAERGIMVIMLHPGAIRTDLTGGHGNDDPPVAAKGLLARIDALTPETSGRFMHANGEELPW